MGFRTHHSADRVRAELPALNSLQLTNDSKVMFPQVCITKGDLIGYYERISERLLPWLRDRPVTLERLPGGMEPGAPHFWQKNIPDYYPPWIERIRQKTEDGREVSYALVNNVQTLLYLVNQGAVTFHTYFSRVQRLRKPDFVLFDLDPGTAGFASAVTVAHALHDLLSKDGIQAYVKTSGKRGLHVLTPPPGNAGYARARSWADSIARRLVEQCPDLATTHRLKNAREGRLYVDVVQNALGHHAVPPYVVRAVATATVSTPLAWDELTDSLDPTQFTMAAVLKRGADPMADLLQPS